MTLLALEPDLLEFDRESIPAEIDEFFVKTAAVLQRAQDSAMRSAEISRLRVSINGRHKLASVKALRSILFRHVLLDLLSQGWSVALTRKRVCLKPGDTSNEDPKQAKERIRQQHLQERNAQLREPSVRDFVKQMERRRLTPQGWHSIFSVMRDGEELSQKLQAAANKTVPAEREKALASCIDPYLQYVEPKEICTETGLRLGDIWRYFRHTWTNSYRTVPGRSMALLIRDRAAAHHPVIGIAALGSSVVQQSVRDAWIGWDAAGIVNAFCSAPTKTTVRWFCERVDTQIQALYKKDLLRDKLITSAHVRRPAETDIERLLHESEAAIKRHRLYPDKKTLKLSAENAPWKKVTVTDLYRSKRCKQLAILLTIRKTIQELDLELLPLKELRAVMQTAKMRRAVTQLFRQIKGERVGICMMDITVCGAIAPYNAILGGKLVCLMLCSPELVNIYQKRYAKQVSVIASAMAGAKVVRSPKLSLLCTTSLYGGGSSQYNRLKVPAGSFGDLPIQDISYVELGMSEGFGSYHFSKETIRAADALLGRLEHGRKVNSIFGEGVNPLMRKMREALTEVGLPSEMLLKHGNRRIVYGVPLATNFSDVLMGLSDRPKYILPLKSAEQETVNLSQFWRTRWLSNRILREGILEEVFQHKLSFPVRHGAMVQMPDEESPEEGDFSLRLNS